MNGIALIIGIAIAGCIVFRMHKKSSPQSHKFYAVLLATFPMYYWGFAIFSGNFQALITEILIGSLFIFVAFIAYYLKATVSLVIAAIGFIAHGLYDVLHLQIHNDSVAPIWWPEFCGSIDIILGVYVLWIAYEQVKPKLKDLEGNA